MENIVLFHLEIVKRAKKLNYNVEIVFKQDKFAPHPHTALSFDVKYPLLRLLLFLSDLKSTINIIA